MEYSWGLVLLMLSACEPEPKGPVEVAVPEAMRFETEHIRREVDVYKTDPSAIARRRMEKAFAAYDARVRALEALAQTQSGPERAATEQQVADMKARRELHWTRAQTIAVETMPVQRAQPVGERVKRGERTKRAVRAERRADAEPPLTERVMKAEPVRPLDR